MRLRQKRERNESLDDNRAESPPMAESKAKVASRISRFRLAYVAADKEAGSASSAATPAGEPSDGMA